jgi:hypothetical protein
MHPHDPFVPGPLLGHGSRDTTMIYIQPTEEELAARAQQFDINAYATVRHRR